MAFKMKGSPFQRNFGIGSPLHAEEKITWKPEKKSFYNCYPKHSGRRNNYYKIQN